MIVRQDYKGPLLPTSGPYNPCPQTARPYCRFGLLCEACQYYLSGHIHFWGVLSDSGLDYSLR